MGKGLEARRAIDVRYPDRVAHDDSVLFIQSDAGKASVGKGCAEGTGGVDVPGGRGLRGTYTTCSDFFSAGHHDDCIRMDPFVCRDQGRTSPLLGE